MSVRSTVKAGGRLLFHGDGLPLVLKIDDVVKYFISEILLLRLLICFKSLQNMPVIKQGLILD